MSASLRVMQALAALGLKTVIPNEPARLCRAAPIPDGSQACVAPALSGEDQDLYRFALRELGEVFRHQDQRVRLAERGDLVRALP
jgi:hypothetical protein